MRKIMNTDWMSNAAEEIAHSEACCVNPEDADSEAIRSVLAKHCPPDVGNGQIDRGGVMLIPNDWLIRLSDAIQDASGLDSSRESAREWLPAFIA